ncbi:flippase activity-associated protein Agl23 [Methanogenium organophilum]|uniref:TIGR03663 family protein n=1 Tax=Methanogenium organophilum TaxID=2199 RepID=A0A9X9S306_METOG|nr:flippase activity-associated protein Agl23 [Methanogenium organophilum]WAI00583.1 TIGR03663 family protein [Methanogenium organophilum]
MKAADSSPTFLSRLRFEHIFLVIFIVALILRFFILDLKLFHHDEAVHAWFSFKLLTEGSYVYDPVYHGPLLYYTTASMFALFGDSDLVGRIVPALLGSLMVLLVWPIYRLGYLEKYGALIAALFLAISPDMVYFSRFLRNDIFIAFFTLLLLVALLYYLEYGQRRYVVVAALAAGLGCCSKENMPIILLIFGVFLLAAVMLKWVHLKKGWWMDFILGIAVMLAVGSLFYSSFGAHPEVLWTGAFQAIEHWTAMSSQQRLGGPPYFYILLFLLYEVPIIYLALVGMMQAALCALFLWKRRRQVDVVDMSAPVVAGVDEGAMLYDGADPEMYSEDAAEGCRMPEPPEMVEPANGGCAESSEAGFEATEFVGCQEDRAGVDPAEEPAGHSSRPKSLLSGLIARTSDCCGDAGRPGFDRRLGFSLFCIWWMCASLGVYAIIGEKVPWLILHQLLPMIFVAAYLMTRKKATLALILSVFLVVMMAHVAFTPADINEPIVQVQNSEELRELFSLIDAGNKTAVTTESVWPLPWYYRGDGSEKITYLSTAADNPEYFRDSEYDVIVSHNPDGFSAVPGYVKTDVIRQSYWFSIYDNGDRLAEYYFLRNGKLGSVNWNIFVLPETTGGVEIPVNVTV